MSTNVVNITSEWKDLTTDETLTQGQNYALQNLGSYDVYINESTTTPDGNDVGYAVKQYESVTLQQDVDNFYIRANGSNGRVVLNLAG